METIGSHAARTHLYKLLDRVARGERITITRRGNPVAMLVPTGEVIWPNRRQAIEAMKQFGKGRKLDGLSIREMIEDGREPDGGR